MSLCYPRRWRSDGAVLSGPVRVQAAFEQRLNHSHIETSAGRKFLDPSHCKVDCASSARQRPVVGGLRGQPASGSLWWPPGSRPWPRLTVPVALVHPIGGLAAQARCTPVAPPFSARRWTNRECEVADKSRRRCGTRSSTAREDPVIDSVSEQAQLTRRGMQNVSLAKPALHQLVGQLCLECYTSRWL